MNAGIDLDAALLFHLVEGGKPAVSEALSLGIREHHVRPKYRQALQLVIEQVQSSGKAPGAKDLIQLFGPVVQATGMELGWVILHLHRRRDFAVLAQATEDVKTHLSSNDPVGAREALLKAAEELRLDQSQGIKLDSLFGLGEEVKAGYEEAEKGVSGIPSPWPSINAMTMGWVLGTNSWFLARPGTGKTFMLMISALHAWEHGQELAAEGGKPLNVLLVSPEMGKVALAERGFTILAKSSFGDVVSGSLGEYGKHAFYSTIDSYSSKEGLYVIDGSQGLTPDRIELAIEQCKADVVMVDSVYRIRWKERAKDRFENMYEGVDRISGWSKRSWSGDRKVAFLAYSQLNREADKKGKTTKSAVALADNISWEADNLFFLEQSVDMKADRRLRLVPEKTRRQGAATHPVMLNWDMTSMDFTEIVEAAQPSMKPKGGFGIDDF